MNFTFEFELDDFQREAAEHITHNKSVVVCAPTGAGKTAIAEIAINTALAENKKIFYTTPLKALSNQKFTDFQKKYGENNVGLATGDTSINRDAKIVIMTTEVFRNILYGTAFGKVEDNLKDVKTVVLDEVHYMNDEQRGTVWEESIIYCPNNIQLVALSATVANADELVNWINTVHGQTELVHTDFRPVPLRHYYYSPSRNSLDKLLTPDKKLNSKIIPERRTRAERLKVKKKKHSVVGLVQQLHENEMLPAIYFTFSRKGCDDNLKSTSTLNLLTNEEREKIKPLVEEFVQDNPYLSKHKFIHYLYQGIASHHAGLLPAFKALVEKLFQQGLIKVVFATETLAAGINMPARTTVISTISKRTDNGHRNLTSNEFLQISGRAGRRGMDKVGYVVTVASAYEDVSEVVNLALSNSDPLESRFSPSYSMVLNLLQRFDIDTARELILKSFGYFASTKRLKPLIDESSINTDKINQLNEFQCEYGVANDELWAYKKNNSTYNEYKRIEKDIKRQGTDPDEPSFVEFREKIKVYYDKIRASHCNGCKVYKKHVKNATVLERYEKKEAELQKVINYERDVYWHSFLNLVTVLKKLNYLEKNFPTDAGITASCLKVENEVFLAELVHSNIMDDLNPVELAGFLSAVISDDSRFDRIVNPFKLSPNTKKAILDAKKIERGITRMQKNYNVEMPIILNSKMSPIIEAWAQGVEWDYLTSQIDVAEGDIVRNIKRTVDILRQLANLKTDFNNIARTSHMAIELINRDPITEGF